MLFSQKITPIQDYQARFYEDYRKVADEYDKEFLKKHDEDLDTTLIFVSSVMSFAKRVLTQAQGRSLLRSDLRIHHSS